MKKGILLGLLLASTICANAQKADSTSTKSGINGNNELKLNLAYTIGGIPELNYERIIKDDMSIGLAVIIGLEENSEYKFGVIPNYRVYFGGKKANGFFIEGNAAVVTSRDDDDYYYENLSTYPSNYNSYKAKTATNFGLGAAAGAKFLTKNGFVGEIYIGGGRLFGSNSVGGYVRSGITIGKRF